jgi:hypothetical protein
MWHDYLTPHERVLLFAAFIISIIMVYHMGKNIVIFYRTRRKLRTATDQPPDQVNLAASRRKQPLYEFILNAVTDPGRRDAAKTEALEDRIRQTFLKGNLFMILTVCMGFFGLWSLLIGLREVFFGAAISSTREIVVITGLLEGISSSLAYQVAPLFIVTCSVLSHIISKNMVQAITREVNAIEIKNS